MKSNEYAPLTLRQRVGDPVLDGDLLAGGDQVNEDLRVRIALKNRAARLEFGPQLFGVGEVAVVTDRERTACVVDGDGLGVLDVRATGRRIPDVADGDAARQPRELVLGERVLDQAHRPMRVELLAVGGDDSRGFLPSVLEGVKAEVRDVCRFGVVEDAEHSAFVVKVVVVRQRGGPRPDR